jgi:iron complex transport system substrate-binding protein
MGSTLVLRHPEDAVHTPRTNLTTLRAALAAAALSCLVLTACGDDDAGSTTSADTPAPATDSDFPVEVLSGPLDGGEEVTVEEQPEAIVSLSPSATEMLFAIDAGDQVVAVDDQSDFPADVPTTDLSGYTPSVEATLGYEPDLVVVQDADPDFAAGLAAAGVPLLSMPAPVDLDEAWTQLERLGAATGHVAEADQVVAETQERIDAVVAETPRPAEPLTYFHELDPTLFTTTSGTFIGSVYGLFGLENIADAAGTTDLYPQLSAEYVVQADPDLVLLADGECCQVTPEVVAQRPGWAGITAVEQGQVVTLDEDVTSRWGPRTVGFVETVAGLVTAAAAKAPTG